MNLYRLQIALLVGLLTWFPIVEPTCSIKLYLLNGLDVPNACSVLAFISDISVKSTKPEGFGLPSNRKSRGVIGARARRELMPV